MSLKLDELWAFDVAIREAISLPAFYDPGIGSLGLIPSDVANLSCTPNNCSPFAQTGGNGVHFSLLAIPDADQANLPVVMTNPGSGGQNIIVGQNLRDFLCFGYHCGYFALEQLSYSLDNTLRTLVNPLGPWTDPAMMLVPELVPLMVAFRRKFRLLPWFAAKHFHELQAQFLPLLILPVNLQE